MLATRTIGHSRPLDAAGRRGRAAASDADGNGDGFQAALSAATGPPRQTATPTVTAAARPLPHAAAAGAKKLWPPPGVGDDAAATGAADDAGAPSEVAVPPSASEATSPLPRTPPVGVATAGVEAVLPDVAAGAAAVDPAPNAADASGSLRKAPPKLADPDGGTVASTLRQLDGGVGGAEPAQATAPASTAPASTATNAPVKASHAPLPSTAAALVPAMLVAQTVTATAMVASAMPNPVGGAPGAAAATEAGRQGATGAVVAAEAGRRGSADALPRDGAVHDMAASVVGTAASTSDSSGPHVVDAAWMNASAPVDVAAATAGVPAAAANGHSVPSRPTGRADAAAAPVAPSALDLRSIGRVVLAAEAATAANPTGSTAPPGGRSAGPNAAVDAGATFGAQVGHAVIPAAANDPGSGTTPSHSPVPGDTSPNLADQLSRPMLGLLTGGGHELVLRLNPPDLGTVAVRVLISGHDVSAWFDASQQSAQQAISQGMSQLHADLANAGYNLNNAWVGGEAWTPRGRAGSSGHTQPGRSAAEDAPVEDASGIASTPNLTGGVSVYV